MTTERKRTWDGGYEDFRYVFVSPDGVEMGPPAVLRYLNALEACAEALAGGIQLLPESSYTNNEHGVLHVTEVDWLEQANAALDALREARK